LCFWNRPTPIAAKAERKFTFLPVEVPRFYARGAAAQTLRSSTGETALVKSLVIWEPTRVRNILGFLPGRNAPGKDKPNTLVVNAYYDSMSAIPDLAPGAEAAGSMAAMLEMARRFKANPPSYNVLFVGQRRAPSGARGHAELHRDARRGQRRQSFRRQKSGNGVVSRLHQRRFNLAHSHCRFVRQIVVL
jgi:hypothetical protein